MENSRNFYINGMWTAPMAGHDFDVVDPSTEEVADTIVLGGQADTDAAVAAAKAAFPKWRLSSKAERLELMQSILDVYMRRSDEMGAVISTEMGAPIDMSKVSQSGTGSFHLKAFIASLKDYEFEHALRAGEDDTRIIHEPIGVCALITPWNWPMNQIALKVIACTSGGLYNGVEAQ